MKIKISFTPLNKRNEKNEFEIEVPKIPNIGDTFFLNKEEFKVANIGWYVSVDEEGYFFQKIIVELK